jgi:hypothetical protein
MVESAGDFARDFDMRLVVLADGHQVRAGHQNIRRLQHGVANQPKGNRFLVDVGGARHVF